MPTIGLIPKDDIVSKKAPYGSGGAKYFSSSQVLTSQGVFVHADSSDAYSMDLDNKSQLSDVYAFQGNQVLDTEDLSENDSTDAYTQRASKAQRQWIKWNNDIIPQLLQPYMTLMQETASLRNIDKVQNTNKCPGCNLGRNITVQCIYFNSKFLELVFNDTNFFCRN